MSFRGKYGNQRGGFKGGREKGRRNNKNSEYRHQDQLTENEVGITEYFSQLEGYSAVIKARFSDFQVNEINLEGKMAKLTDTSVPKIVQQENYSYESTNESPHEKIPQTTWEALRNLVKATESLPITLEADNFSKDDRKSIHICIKSYFGKNIVASTITKDEKTVMEFRKYDKDMLENRSDWPDGVAEFVHFIVYKELMDTMQAVFKIGQLLKISPMKITYCGVKDRRAKTSQWFCIKKCDPQKLLAKTKPIRNLHVGNFEFKEKCLQLGELKGNRFRIALRNVQADDELITKSIEHVKEHGFVNYYGLQRFGNDKEVPTFLIGIKLLQGQWKEAVDLILKVKAGDDPTQRINQAKKLYSETRDAAKALKLCDRNSTSVEKKLLEGLVKHHENDFVNSLEFIPRNMRLMYIHAFQSLIWNKMASKRISEYGFKPVEGDLVFIDKLQEEDPLIEDVYDEADEKEIILEEKAIISETKDDSTINGEKVRSGKFPVRPLQADELDKYNIHDVVLPLPGYDVIYPENMERFYKEEIEKCGLSLKMPQQKVKTYNLSGTYRKVCQHIQDLEWKILYYNDPTDNLIRSDLEEFNGEDEPQSVEDGKYKAVVVAFTLNSSSYATMVLREIIKCNTSSSFQAGCNNYAEPKNKFQESIEINDVQPGSLLADKEKYEDFKNNLFKDILGETSEESSSKRELENKEENEINSKKLKVDAN